MKYTRHLGLAVCALALAGCVTKRDSSEYVAPQPDMPAAFRNIQPADAPADDRVLKVPQPTSKWWRDFGSDEMTALVELALANNWDLKAAVARIAQAEAPAAISRADEWPLLQGLGRLENKSPGGGIGTATTANTPKESRRLYQVGVRATYELDLWGKNAAATESAIARARASAYDRETIAHTLTADVVSGYLQILSLQDRVKLARQTEQVLRGMLNAVEERFKGGDATQIDVEQQRAAVMATAAVIPVLELQLAQSRDAMALLLGIAPSDLTVTGSTLDGIKIPEAAPGMPSDLLRRRPDIKQAEAALIGADANIDGARAKFLPSFTLTGEYGLGSFYLSNLLNPAALFWSLAMQATQTLFDAGKTANEVEAAQARHMELTATYMRTVIAALRDVEDALAALYYYKIQELAQTQAVHAATQAFELSEVSYKIGTIDYLTVLNTQRTMYNEMDTLLSVKFDRARAAVDLYRALGGGMEYGEGIYTEPRPLEDGETVNTAPADAMETVPASATGQAIDHNKVQAVQ